MSKIYQKLFAKFYDFFMVSFEAKIENDRMQMLDKLKGNILDVGSGTGVNFKYFNANVKVFAVEPSKAMQDKSIAKVNAKNIELINLGVNDKLLHNKIKEKSLDAIVCTLVLCTIPKPDLALENFKKWLKPNGKLIILEHIHSDKKFNAKFENIVNPLWKKFGDGCNLNRNTDKLIKEKGFKAIEESYFTLGLRIHKGIYELFDSSIVK